MKHSVQASATYKPKQCTGPMKRIITKAITNEYKTIQTSKSICMELPTNDDIPYKSRKVKMKPTHPEQIVKIDSNMNGSEKILDLLMSHTKRKIKKILLPNCGKSQNG